MKGVLQMRKRTLGGVVCSIFIAIGGLAILNKIGKKEENIEILHTDTDKDFVEVKQDENI
jgi:hypothetical protein